MNWVKTSLTYSCMQWRFKLLNISGVRVPWYPLRPGAGGQAALPRATPSPPCPESLPAHSSAGRLPSRRPALLLLSYSG